jgi:hypothetical protein
MFDFNIRTASVISGSELACSFAIREERNTEGEAFGGWKFPLRLDASGDSRFTTVSWPEKDELWRQRTDRIAPV